MFPRSVNEMNSLLGKALCQRPAHVHGVHRDGQTNHLRLLQPKGTTQLESTLGDWAGGEGEI